MFDKKVVDPYMPNWKRILAKVQFFKAYLVKTNPLAHQTLLAMDAYLTCQLGSVLGRPIESNTLEPGMLLYEFKFNKEELDALCAATKSVEVGPQDLTEPYAGGEDDMPWYVSAFNTVSNMVPKFNSEESDARYTTTKAVEVGSQEQSEIHAGVENNRPWYVSAFNTVSDVVALPAVRWGLLGVVALVLIILALKWIPWGVFSNTRHYDYDEYEEIEYPAVVVDEEQYGDSGVSDMYYDDRDPIEGSWRGYIGNKYLINMEINLYQDGQLHGSYYYGDEPKNGYLTLYGNIDGSTFELQETNDKGDVTGHFRGRVNDDELIGTFVNYRGQKFDFYLLHH